MPMAVAAWAATTFLAAAPALGITVAGIVGWTAGIAATLAISAGLSKLSAALMGRPRMGSGMASRRTAVRDSTQPRTILYGEATTGGVLAYVNTSGIKNEYLDFVVAVAGHEITAITDVWFDDDKIDAADINGGASAGGVVSGTNKYAGVAWIYKYLGTDTQTASSILTTAYPSEWTSDHRGRGNAYVHIRLRRDKEVFDQGPPNNFRFGYQGAKVYDPRLDTTNGGSGSHRLSDPATWEYSNNPALCCTDYLIGGAITNSATRVNMRGFGADPGDVDWSSVIAAANVCDENVTIPPASPATTQNRYECDGALSSGEAPAENLEQLLTAMMGQMVYSSGRYQLYAGAYDTATQTLSEADLAGPIEYVTGGPRSDRYNAVKGVRWDLVTGQQTEFTPKTNSTYESEDGGARLYRDIELPFTVDEYRAQRIAQLILNRSREQQTLVFRGNLGCLRIGVWETVQVTIAELGLSGKVFRCISREVQPSGDEHIVLLTLREEFAATYTDPIVADYGDLTPVTPLPAPDDYRNNIGFSVVDDPEFEWGIDGDDLQYWTHSAHVTYQDSDVAQIIPDGSTDAYVRTRSTTTVAKQLYGAWGIAVAIRYRVTSALTASNARMYVHVYASPKAFSEVGSTKDSLEIDLSGAVVGTWYTKAAVLGYEPAAGGNNYFCYVEARVESADVSAGTIEIDYLEGLKTAAPANYSANTAGTVPKTTAAPSGKVLKDDGTWGTAGGWVTTAAETSAGVTVVNDQYPPGHVLRYGTNTTPGTTDMSTAFNAAAAVITYYDITIPPGAYKLNSAWTVTVPVARSSSIWGYGAELFTGHSGAALKLIGKSHVYGCTVYGIVVNHRNNSSTNSCGFDIVGTNHATLVDCAVEANNTSAAYAAFRLRESTQGDGDTGAFWTTLERCHVRERAGSDTGNIGNGIQINGQCNATTIRGCTITSCTYAVEFRDPAAISLANGCVIDGNFFEGDTTAIRLYGPPGGSGYYILGLRVTNNRFEAITQSGISIETTSGAAANDHVVPLYVAGNSLDTSVTNWIYNPLGAKVTNLQNAYYGPAKDTEEWINGNRRFYIQNTDSPTPSYANLIVSDMSGGSTYKFGHLVIGGTHFWLGSNGQLRYKSSNPASIDDGAQVATSVTVPSAANPTGSVGLTAVNGSASTFLRSDGAPALSQSIAPTWTGVHRFAANIDIDTEKQIGYDPVDNQATVAGASVPDYGITIGSQHTGWSPNRGLSIGGYAGVAIVVARTLQVEVLNGVLKASGVIQVAGTTVAGASGTISLGATTATTVGAAGGASAPPATPTGYLKIGISGTIYQIPYYATA